MILYKNCHAINCRHYSDVIMGSIASQITSLTIVYSSVYSGEDQRKHRSFASLAFVWGIHRRTVNSPHKGPVTRKMFPFDDVIMDKGDIKSHLFYSGAYSNYICHGSVLVTWWIDCRIFAYFITSKMKTLRQQWQRTDDKWDLWKRFQLWPMPYLVNCILLCQYQW